MGSMQDDASGLACSGDTSFARGRRLDVFDESSCQELVLVCGCVCDGMYARSS